MKVLKIGNLIPIKNSKPKNSYCIITNVMHGDADMYTDQCAYIENADSALLLYQILIAHKDERDKDIGLIENLENESDAEFYDDDLYELWPNDCTCDHMYKTRLQTVDITYFDENGIEHYVDIHER